MEYGEVQDSHVSGDVAGGDPVYLDVVLAPLVAEGLGQLAERALRGCVRGHREPALQYNNCAMRVQNNNEAIMKHKSGYCQQRCVTCC